jgi:O-acetyl-ADP-ribose deacetylase (regulator of RNase III)
MVIHKTEDIFTIETDVLVHPVNCVGILGAGIGRRYKELFPEMWAEYKMACSLGMVFPNRIHHYKTRSGPQKFIVSLPTKSHPKRPGTFKDIKAALLDLSQFVWKEGLSTIVMPRIGCGLGGPAFHDIFPSISQIFGQMPGVELSIVHLDKLTADQVNEARLAYLKKP